MDRHFTPEDIHPLSESQRELILTQQAETLRHAQEQGQKFFRILLAASALILGLAGTEVYTAIVNNGQLYQLLDSNLVFQNGIVEAAPGIINDSLSVVVTLGVVTAGLLFEAGMTTIWIMKIDGPLPTTRVKNVEDEANEDLMVKWIVENDKRVTEALIHLNRCFTLLWYAVGLSSLTVFLFAVTIIGFLPAMGVLHLAVLFLLPLGFIYYVIRPAMIFWRNDTDSLRSRSDQALAHWADSWEHIGPSAGMKIALLLIISTTWGKSATVINYWLQFP